MVHTWRIEIAAKNFHIEMYLRFNLGPLHHSDVLINEILAFDTNKTYLRVETDPKNLVTKDVNKSCYI